MPTEISARKPSANDTSDALGQANVDSFRMSVAATALMQSGDIPATIVSQPVGSAPADFRFLSPALEPDEIGRLGNYRVLNLIGRGGMAYVFRAEDVDLRRRVALKIARPDLQNEAHGCERFLREARLMAAVKHEHLVVVYQVGRDHDTGYMAMELLDGDTLEARIARDGPLPHAECVRVGREISKGLAAIHRHGLIHRDLKPANLWLEAPQGKVKVLDFGLARSMEKDEGFTQTGTVVGTPGYMSPEQARGEPLDARSDLFSLGSVLYYMCTGAPPFHASTAVAVLTALAVSEPPPPTARNANIHPAISNLIMRLLSKDAADRPGSVDEVIAELARIDHGQADRDKPSLRRQRRAQASAVHPWQRWAAVAVVLAVVGALVSPKFMGRPGGPEPGPGAEAIEGDATFLSDLKPLASKDWNPVPPGPPDHRKEFKQGPPGRFSGVRVQGRPSPHGLFMHPPFQPEGGRSFVTYDLGRRFAEFHVDVSLNDGPEYCETPLTFIVRADGKIVWHSKPVYSQAETQRCDVEVRGVNMLTLEVSCPGEPRGAHAVWIEPHLRK